MKLVKIYDVVKDETFVVELLDRQRNVFALKSVVQDRGISLNQGIITKQKAMLSQPFRLVFNHRQLTRGKVPRACFREGQKPIHLLPDLVRPTSRITVFVKVLIPSCEFPNFRSRNPILPRRLRLKVFVILRPFEN